MSSNSDICEVECVHPGAVRQAMADRAGEQDVEHLAGLFQLLASPSRLRIVEALADRELCVCDLSRVVGLSQSAVSHHLRQMRQQRIVRWRKDGRMAYYRLDDAHISRLFDLGLEHVTE